MGLFCYTAALKTVQVFIGIIRIILADFFLIHKLNDYP